MDKLITTIGLNKINSATPLDQLNITHIAIGDGNGSFPTLSVSDTTLTNELDRKSCSAPFRDDADPTKLKFEIYIPPEEGGYTIREIGLFDVDGDLISVALTRGVSDSGIPKPNNALEQGSYLTLVFVLELDNASDVDVIYQDSGIIDHQGLFNKDASNAHPIGSISGVADRLAKSGNAVFSDTSKFATGETKDGVISLSTIQAMRDASTKFRTEGFYSSSAKGKAEYVWLDGADKIAEGYTDGYSSFEYGSSGIFACLVKEGITINKTGAVGDGLANDTLSFTSAIDITPENSTLTAEGGLTYYFGQITGDSVLKSISKNIKIDWNGSKILVDGDISGAYTGTAFIEFLDTSGSMVNFVFEDSTFAFGNASRGVTPILIKNTSLNTQGYEIGNCHIEKGQSIFTAFSTSPETAQASGITLTGKVTGNQVYYGVNLAANGNNVIGDYSVKECLRLAFVYNVDDVKLKGHCDIGRPTSGAVNISCLPQYPNKPTKNLDLDMSFGTMDGPVLFNVNNTGGNPVNDGIGSILDVKLKLNVKTIGSNLNTVARTVIFRDYDSGGSEVSGSSIIIDNIELDLITPNYTTSPLDNLSDSQDLGRLSVVNQALPFYLLEGFTLYHSQSITNNLQAEFSTNEITIPIKYLYPLMSNQLLALRLTIATKENNNTFNQISAITVFDLLGYVSSGGVVVAVSSTQVSQTVFGAVTPTFTFTGVDNIGFSIATSGYTDNAANKISVKTEILG